MWIKMPIRIKFVHCDEAAYYSLLFHARERYEANDERSFGEDHDQRHRVYMRSR
jgi:hypothetical protein